METELLNIFDEGRKQIGVASREEVHKKGYWHETFHCWFISKEQNQDCIYFQNRSKIKKDYPGLLDITAAGHLLSHESVMDGIREVEEELGISVAFDELIPFGVIDYCAEKENFIDKELAHVFVYRSHHRLDEFVPQLEEVSGVVRIAMDDFYELWFNGKDSIASEGFEISNGKRVQVRRQVTKKDFVPHEDYYYRRVLHSIRELETEKC
ncbi:NUDIX domain-containing protein [Bacillus sp. ISL-47]|uniref:NUDIX hydrolase n=1 Tax=Bacillus sp. ISL-47 TaxID=2819130 RepID=UPI001BEB5750|nr:NUDIX domain-containing protein [Bacillus sp. ISL-47]MBT2687657.1 NUDIX domain-containing protein [Bacillus sp. ISL-47]MBT2710691.1 NUDIX domain-containing protein [Pseudomonas sp. ISL-84]